MKKRLVFLTILLSLSMAGCSQKEANTEPTEVVIETETEEPTEEVAVETETVIETEEPTERIYHDALIVYADGTYDFTDEYVAEMAQNPFFEGCTEDEVRDYLKSNSNIKNLLQSNPKETVDNYIYGLSEDGQTTYAQLIGRTNSTETEETQSSTTKNSSSTSTSTDTKTNNNSSSTKSNTANTNQETQTPSTNESTPSNITDNNINQSESQDINNNKVGTGDQYFFQDEGADWGGSDGSSANWQY